MNASGTTFLDSLDRELRRFQLPRSRRKRAVDEAAYHLEETVAHLECTGLPSAAAWGEALRRFGSPESLAESFARAVPPTAPRSWIGAWVLTTVLGSLLGVLAIQTAGGYASSLVGMMLVLPLAGATVGLAMGAFQGALRRTGFLECARWTLATGAATALGLTVSTVLVEASTLEGGSVVDETLALVLIGTLTGALVALFQRNLVESATKREKLDWILCSALGGGGGLALGGLFAVVLVDGFRSDVGLFLPVGIGSGLLALLTAVPLWPGRRSVPWRPRAG